MVLRTSLKRVVPGSVPPWRALVASRLPGVVFRAPVVVFHPTRKHGSDGLARFRPCCDAADFLQAPSQEKQAQSRQAIGVASEAHLKARSRCLANFLWFVSSFCLRQKLLLLVRRSPLNAACQLLCWPPLASRNFAAAPAALFFALGRVEAGAWKRVLGGWDWTSKLLISFAVKKIYVLKSLNPKP